MPVTFIQSGRFGVAQTPTDVADLSLWLKGDGVLYKEAARTNLATVDADAVGSWSDGSTNAFHANAGDTATLKTAIRNGRNVVRWTSPDLLTSSCAANTKGITIMAALSVSSFASPRTILGASVNGGMQFRFDISGKLQLLKQSMVSIGLSTTVLSTSTWYVVAVTYSSSGAYEFYVNGTIDGSDTNNLTLDAGSTRIGANLNGGEPMEGDFGEIAKWDHVLTSGELSSMFAYFARWS